MYLDWEDASETPEHPFECWFNLDNAAPRAILEGVAHCFTPFGQPHEPMKTLSVVVPVYFNDSSLLRFLGELHRVERTLVEHALGLELISDDDVSGDDSGGDLAQLTEQSSATREGVTRRELGPVTLHSVPNHGSIRCKKHLACRESSNPTLSGATK